MAAPLQLVVRLIALFACLMATPLIPLSASATTVVEDGAASAGDAMAMNGNSVIGASLLGRSLLTTPAARGLEAAYAVHGNLEMVDHHQRALLQQPRSINCYATLVKARRSYKWVGADIRKKHSILVNNKFGGKYRGSALIMFSIPPAGVSARALAEKQGFGMHFQQQIYAVDHKQALADLRQYWSSAFAGQSKFYAGITRNSVGCGDVVDSDGATHNGRMWGMRLQPGIQYNQVEEYIDCAVIPAIKNLFGNVTFASAANDTSTIDNRNAAPLFASNKVLSAATYILQAPNITTLKEKFPPEVATKDAPVLLFQGLGYGVMSVQQEDIVLRLFEARVDLVAVVLYRPQFLRVIEPFQGDVLRVWSQLI